MTHLGMMVLFAALVSVVVATLMRDERGETFRTGIRIFGGFVAGAWLVGWVMFGWFG